MSRCVAMAMNNIFSKFAARTNFVNMGLGTVSALFAVQFAAGTRDIPDAAIVAPALAYILSAIAAFYGIYASRRGRRGYDVWRDSVPLTAFAACTLLAGIQKNWVFILLGVALASWIVLQFHAEGDGDYDDDDDRIEIRFR